MATSCDSTLECDMEKKNPSTETDQRKTHHMGDLEPMRINPLNILKVMIPIHYIEYPLSPFMVDFPIKNFNCPQLHLITRGSSIENHHVGTSTISMATFHVMDTAKARHPCSLSPGSKASCSALSLSDKMSLWWL